MLISAVTNTVLFYSNPNPVHVDIFKYVLLLYFLYLVLVELLDMYPGMSLRFIFLCTFGVFMLSRVALDGMGLCEFEKLVLIRKAVMSVSEQYTLLSVLTLSVAGFDLGGLVFRRSLMNRAAGVYDPDINPKVLYIGFILMAVFVFPAYFRTFLKLSFILDSKNYLLNFTGGLSGLHYPVWTVGAVKAFTLGFFLVLVAKPKKVFFAAALSLYMPLLLLDSFRGQRGPVLVFILFIVWYFVGVYNVKFRLRYMIAGAVVMIVFSQLMVAYRSNKQHDGGFIIPFLKSQGISLHVPAYMIHYKNEFRNESYPYIFAPIVDQLYLYLHRDAYRQGQSLSRLQYTNDLNHKMMFFLDAKAYLSGRGIGSAMLAEFYDMGGRAGVLVLSLLFFLLVRLVEKYFFTSYISVILLSPVVMSIIYSPRNRVFGFVKEAENYLFILVSAVILNMLLNALERRLPLIQKMMPRNNREQSHRGCSGRTR